MFRPRGASWVASMMDRLGLARAYDSGALVDLLRRRNGR